MVKSGQFPSLFGKGAQQNSRRRRRGQRRHPRRRRQVLFMNTTTGKTGKQPCASLTWQESLERTQTHQSGSPKCLSGSFLGCDFSFSTPRMSLLLLDAFEMSHETEKQVKRPSEASQGDKKYSLAAIIESKQVAFIVYLLAWLDKATNVSSLSSSCLLVVVLAARISFECSSAAVAATAAKREPHFPPKTCHLSALADFSRCVSRPDVLWPACETRRRWRIGQIRTTGQSVGYRN